MLPLSIANTSIRQHEASIANIARLLRSSAPYLECPPTIKPLRPCSPTPMHLPPPPKFAISNLQPASPDYLPRPHSLATTGTLSGSMHQEISLPPSQWFLLPKQCSLLPSVLYCPVFFTAQCSSLPNQFSVLPDVLHCPSNFFHCPIFCIAQCSLLSKQCSSLPNVL